ncbi:MAG: rhodanese-like domain-containing protein [Candidatus Hodarchaeales archaeon]
MRVIVIAALLGTILSLFLSPLAVVATESKISNSYTDISVEEAHGLINTTSTLLILDVRTLEEFEEGHIISSVLIPLADLEDRADELPTDNHTPILVYCRSGGRSASASAILVSMGYDQVYNLVGGFLAWKSAGYPYEKGNPTETDNSAPVETTSQLPSSDDERTSLPILFALLGLVSGLWLRQKKKHRSTEK